MRKATAGANIVRLRIFPNCDLWKSMAFSADASGISNTAIWTLPPLIELVFFNASHRLTILYYMSEASL